MKKNKHKPAQMPQKEKKTVMAIEISRQPRAILFTSPAPGEPSTQDQYDQLVSFAEARGIEPGWHVPFSDPIPGRMMVSPEGLKHLADTIDVVLYVENGRPIAHPVRPATIRN